MKVIERRGERGLVAMGGAEKEIMLTLTPEASAGDFVIVHAGYALQVIDEREAEETLALLRAIEGSAET